MTSLKPFVLLMLAFGIISAFSVSDYLHPTESKASVQYTNFTLGNTSYSIVSINGADTFLVSGGNPVSKKSDIEAILNSYYSTFYLPSSADIDNLENLIQSYNYSRNDGGLFKGYEEYTCRDILYIDGKQISPDNQHIVCRNESDSVLCQDAADLMFEELMNSPAGPPVGSAGDLTPLIAQFGFASYGTDAILSNDMSLLEAAQNDPAQMPAALSYLANTTPLVSIYASQMESSIFTMNNASYWGLCPDISFNHTVLTDINALVAN